MTQHLELMRYRRAAQRRYGNDLRHVEPFSRRESQQDALPLLISQCDKKSGNIAPFGRQFLDAVG
ncbi:MAG TPA: hypothetical protein VGK14_04070 [Novimethylophilus sp.]|uniref:hypothetical protein n=1 Tax=Novimethylophilus sp. TaxID=2137426 RepID=UPI002F425426